MSIFVGHFEKKTFENVFLKGKQCIILFSHENGFFSNILAHCTYVLLFLLTNSSMVFTSIEAYILL